jgi:flagellar P-ring protein precursor FlgI
MEGIMKQIIKSTITLFIALLIITSFIDCQTASGARLKDIATLKGLRTNQLVGYGLVVGLNGTGDGSGTQFTTQSLVNMMERLGIHTLADEVKVKNVAGVIVTAVLPAFARKGSKIDILVSSIGDADSLNGGTLLMTPLKGADNNVYALAQGPLIVGGFAAGGKAGGGVQKNHPTVARVPDGATIEREISFQFTGIDDLTIALRKPDFTTAVRVSNAINQGFGAHLASPLDAGTVKIDVPKSLKDNLIEMVAVLEQLDVQPDMKARIILSERTGTVVMGQGVQLSPVAIAHGNLSVQIKETSEVSQPNAFAGGRTAVTPNTDISVSEEENKLIIVSPKGTNLGDLVNALNAIGVSPRDLITVFQAIKAAGALQADLEII